VVVVVGGGGGGGAPVEFVGCVDKTLLGTGLNEGHQSVSVDPQLQGAHYADQAQGAVHEFRGQGPCQRVQGTRLQPQPQTIK
jgi:hypothetical protein